jgi:transcriptional regulator with XRE-family HTH domain
LGEVSEAELRRTIGKTARAARSALRMTQAEVAAAVGVAPEVYGRIERGLLMPSVTTLVSIATVLRVPPDALLGWSELQARKRSDAYDRLLTILDAASDSELRRALAVLQAVFAKEPSK